MSLWQALLEVLITFLGLGTLDWLAMCVTIRVVSYDMANLSARIWRLSQNRTHESAASNSRNSNEYIYIYVCVCVCVCVCV